jgi:predicted ATPase/class 3 adenylate cyclase
MSPPSGTVTFLFTDIEGSTRLWQADEPAMRAALSRHDQLLRQAIADHDGMVFSSMGDGMAAAFSSASAAVVAALDAQRSLGTEVWPTSSPLRVRMGLHIGEVEFRDGNYFGTAVNRAARLMAIGHGGQVLVSSTLAEVAGDIGTGLVDLGEHRLRDLDLPMRVFQVGDARFPPLRSLDAVPGNLPLQLSSFIGREDELLLIGKALQENRLVTLVGVGGVGKTRLALQASADVLPGFPDGVWLVELAPVRDPERVADAFAGAFQVTPRPGSSLNQSIVAFLHDQRLLIVLDNCEHLLRPVAEMVAEIERACPGVRILATSREGLSLRGERMIMVPSLDLPTEGATVETVAASQAVRLFTERASSVKGDFVIDAANASDVAEVCRRLDGVPLAIELASARIQLLTPAELAGRIGQRFRLLTGGDRLAVGRHQTLRTTIDWSYDLCREDEQRLLARLSVFSGGASLEAVEAVCGFAPVGDEEVIDVLANLVARSLAVADQTPTQTRYRLLETIRQYAQERLEESGEVDLLRCRHADHFIRFAAFATPQVFGPGEIEWGRRIAKEHDNFHAAMGFALQRQDVDRVMGLICHLPTHLDQVERLIVFDPHPVLELPGAWDHPGVGRVLWEAADRANAVNDFARCETYLTEAEEAVRLLGPSPGYLDVITLCMDLHRDMSDPEGFSEISLARYQRELAAERAATAAFGFAGYVGSLAWTNPPLAAERAIEAVALARRSGMPSAIAANLTFQSMALAETDPMTARQLLSDAVATSPGSWNVLQTECTAAGRLGEWELLIGLAQKLFWLDKRSGVVSHEILLGLFNFVARALCSHDPEAAAVLQGAVLILTQPTGSTQPRSDDQQPGHGIVGVTSRPQENPFGDFMRQVRRECTSTLVNAVGDQRLRQLRAQGAAMTREQASAFALARVDQYLDEHPTPTAIAVRARSS